jgi:hypothetical protein
MAAWQVIADEHDCVPSPRGRREFLAGGHDRD